MLSISFLKNVLAHNSIAKMLFHTKRIYGSDLVSSNLLRIQICLLLGKWNQLYVLEIERKQTSGMVFVFNRFGKWIPIAILSLVTFNFVGCSRIKPTLYSIINLKPNNLWTCVWNKTQIFRKKTPSCLTPGLEISISEKVRAEKMLLWKCIQCSIILVWNKTFWRLTDCIPIFRSNALFIHICMYAITVFDLWSYKIFICFAFFFTHTVGSAFFIFIEKNNNNNHRWHQKKGFTPPN